MSAIEIAATEIQPGMTLRVAEYRGCLLVGRDEFPADRDAVVEQVDVLPSWQGNPQTVIVAFRGEGAATCVGGGAVLRVAA